MRATWVLWCCGAWVLLAVRKTEAINASGQPRIGSQQGLRCCVAASKEGSDCGTEGEVHDGRHGR